MPEGYNPQTQPIFINTENENSLLKYQIDVEATLEQIRMMLLDINFDYKTRTYTDGKPLYAIEHINKIMDIVKSFINKELVLSGFSAENISNLVRNGMMSLSLYLLKISNMEGGVDNKEDNNIVLNSILNYAFSNMKRALEYKTLTHVGRADIKEFNNPMPDQMGYPQRDPRMNMGRRF